MIEFKMGDWRTNVSLLGLMNILDHSGKKYEFGKDEITGEENQILLIKENVLEGFENDYFKYFIDVYEKNLPWYRIANYKNKIDEYLNNLGEFDEEKLKDLNKQIDLVKDYMRRTNYTKVYELIDENVNIEAKVKELKKINLKKKEEVQDKVDEIESELRLLSEITDYVNSEKARDYMGAKGAIYTFINRGIEGVSFLNPQTKIKDIFLDYKEYFLDTLLEYQKEDKEKYKLNCFSCNNPIKNMKLNMNLVKNTGFDQMRKSSYIWNHESDFAICNSCLFLYSCLSAGFHYSMNEGIFVNYNYDLEGLKKVNRSLKEYSLAELNRPENAYSYRKLVMAIENAYNNHIEYTIRDMQIVRYKDENYKFNLLSKDALKIIRDSKADLEAIEKAGYREGKQNIFSIYDLVLDRIFNNQNLFSLIHFLIVNLISNSAGIMKFYNIYHVSRLLNINTRMIGEGYKMKKEKENIDTIEKKKERREYTIDELTDFSRAAGFYLRKRYMEFMKDGKRVENRMKSITYKMSNALNTNNKGAFMNTLVNIYSYVNETIPMYLAEALKDEVKLETVGYAFVVGINSDDKNNKGGNEDEK